MTFEEWWEAPKTVAQICASPKNIAQQAYQAGRDSMKAEAVKVCDESDESDLARWIGEIK